MSGGGRRSPRHVRQPASIGELRSRWHRLLGLIPSRQRVYKVVLAIEAPGVCAMPSIVYVHGIANRGPDYDRTFERIQKQIKTRRSDIEVHPCNWSAPLGARLPGRPKSLPGSPGAAAARPLPPELEVWALLEVQPLAEVAELAKVGFKPPLSAAPEIETELRRRLEDRSLEQFLLLIGLDSPSVLHAFEKLLPDVAFRNAAKVKTSARDVVAVVVRATIS